MTNKQAEKTLSRYIRWRRGGRGKVPPQWALRNALDIALEALKEKIDAENK